MPPRYTKCLHAFAKNTRSPAAGFRAPQKIIARPHILCRPGNRYILVGIPPSPCASCPVWVPAMLRALGRICFRHLSPSRGLDATVLVGPRQSFRAASVRAASCSCRCRRGILPWRPVTGVLPVPTCPVVQRLGTEAGAALLGGASAGACLAPVVIRCRFRSTVAVPIPFTRARSSTCSKGPCCRRYATIASAFTGPTFANPCCSVDASAVLMLIRSAAKAIPLNSSPSTSALHENQGPTV